MAEHATTRTKSRAGEPVRNIVQRLWQLWRLLAAVVLGFRGEALALRAGNITFITITSLVPMVAVILSLLHALKANEIDPLLLRLFEDVLSPGGRAQSEATIRKLVAAASSRTAGGLSFAVVLVSAGLLLRHLDASLNDVWAVRRKRPILVSIALYAGVLLVGPMLIALALVGTDGAKRLILMADLPYSTQAFVVGSALVAATVFTLLYKFAPHAPVPWRSAIIGGVVAGVAWEVARHTYSAVAGLFFSANPLYGSLGIAPLFLMWIYVGWYIILSGARLAYAVEHADFHDEFREIFSHPRSQELIATRIAELVTRAALAGEVGPTSKLLAATLKLPEQRIIEVVLDLLHEGLLVASKKGELSPAKDPAELTLADISAAVGGAAKLLKREKSARVSPFEDVSSYFSAADETTVEKLREVSWLELARGARGQLQKR
jgi:membrane protein